RGLPVTAENVLGVRAGLTRAQASETGDLKAAVFLRGQELPITRGTLLVVRQALASGTGLGSKVEGLREALAGLAARLAASPGAAAGGWAVGARDSADVAGPANDARAGADVGGPATAAGVGGPNAPSVGEDLSSVDGQRAAGAAGTGSGVGAAAEPGLPDAPG